MLDVGRAALAMNARRPLGAEVAARYAEAVRRRARREPLQRILCWEEFRGLRLSLTADVLIPRPETEQLVEWALELAGPIERLCAIDVGTGSGCIACAIAHARRDADVTAIDVSDAALAVARKNAEALGLTVRAVVEDLLTARVTSSADLIVANLPYVPDDALVGLAPEVTAHDPRLALAGGPDGLDVIRRLVPDAHRVLRPGGALVLETFSAAQARLVVTLLRTAGFVDVTTRDDLAGITRFVAGRRP
jgi:release factor glutamine methyltransferase